MVKTLSIHEISKVLGVTIKTLKLWDNDGKLNSAMRTPGGHKELEKERQGGYIENNNKSNIS